MDRSRHGRTAESRYGGGGQEAGRGARQLPARQPHGGHGGGADQARGQLVGEGAGRTQDRRDGQGHDVEGRVVGGLRHQVPEPVVGTDETVPLG